MATNSLKQLFEAGFLQSELDLPSHLLPSTFPRLAQISFRTGLRAYFSTVQVAGLSEETTTVTKGSSSNEMFWRKENCFDYIEAYTEAILHLHHGIELALKELLRQKHSLLACKELPSSAVLLCRMLNKESFAEDPDDSPTSVEFGEALKRIVELIKHKVFDETFGFIQKNHDFLKHLNKLRNRIIHRGMFIMDYSAFDLMVSKYLLPFMVSLSDLPQFKNSGCIPQFSSGRNYWYNKKLACDIDPINEIVEMGQHGAVDRKKLAFLKELGRAAYHNPLNDADDTRRIDDSAERFRYEILAQVETSNHNPHAYEAGTEWLKCPVCGLGTLVKYIDGEGEHSHMSCVCCTFSPNKSLGNGRDHGLAIDDFWTFN
ncbi:MAG: hypothetical protein PHQ05_04740 [Sterolibacterium sp.]|nr:hypothetical protein [Sterolibacterium sp.]